MPRVVSGMPASLPQRDDPLAGLAECVRRLDPGTRALLDLSVRRRLRDDAMAPLLGTDPFHLAWRRARALERVASDLGGDQPLPLAQVRAALESLPREAWDPLRDPAIEAAEPEPAGPQPVAAPEPEAEAEAEVTHAPGVEPEAATETEAPEATSGPHQDEVVTTETEALAVEPSTTALVPLASLEIAERPARLVDRLDAFATSAPTLRSAFGLLGRAFGRKAVRLVVWRRRAS